MSESDTGTLVYLESAESLDFREYDLPSPDPGAVLTEVVRANVCGSELHIWQGEHPLIQDAVLGHEALCRITELGNDVETDYAGQLIEPGDLVAPAYFATCGKCSQCGVGAFGQCENAYAHWSQSPDESPHFHGTFGTHYYIHPDQYFYKVPPGIKESVAASANCALSQALCGFDAVNLSWDDTVVVQGAGGLGLNATAVATEAGAETIVIDGVDTRLERAKAFGADHVINLDTYDTVAQRVERVEELTDGRGADLAVEVTGVPAAFSEGVELLGPGGRYLEMGNIIPGHETSFDPGKLTRKSIDITSLMRYEPWYLHDALEFLSERGDKYPFDELLDATFPLDETQRALERSDNRDITRASLVPDPS